MSVSIISIEGNIGAGKSTFLEELKTMFSQNSSVVFLDEPVEIWESVKDKYGVSMLQKFYSNPRKYSFAFQMMAYVSRLSNLRKMLESLKAEIQNEDDHKVIITERSIYTDKCVFAKMLYDEGNMEDVEFQIYLKWFDEFSIKQLDSVIMLQTDPEKSHERVLTRGRVGEVIPLEYLQKCEEYHKEMLAALPNKVIFDANGDIYKNPDILEGWLKTTREIVLGFLYKTA